MYLLFFHLLYRDYRFLVHNFGFVFHSVEFFAGTEVVEGEASRERRKIKGNKKKRFMEGVSPPVSSEVNLAKRIKTIQARTSPITGGSSFGKTINYVMLEIDESTWRSLFGTFRAGLP